MAIAIAMPREVPTAAEASVLDIRCCYSSSVVGACALYQTHDIATSSILRGNTRPRCSSDFAGVACIRLLAY
jgi:hypothetical protein